MSQNIRIWLFLKNEATIKQNGSCSFYFDHRIFSELLSVGAHH